MWTLDQVPFKDTVENFASAENIFTDEEIKKIIKLGKSKKAVDSLVGSDGGKKKLKIRKAKTAWVAPCEESEWLFRKLTDIITKANNDYFNFDLVGMMEPLQFTIYDEKGSKYRPHIDKVQGNISRKLSLVVQLSSPEDYEGGELEIFTSDKPQKVKQQKGHVSFFPSYTLHGVKPVTKGTRYSLVVWVHGPAFR